jgi:hypothetical protein
VQVEHLRPLLPGSVRILADRWYATGAFLLACQRMQVEVLLRLKRNRKLYRPAPVPLKGQCRAPRKDGPLFQGSHPETWGEPEQEWRGTDEAGKPMVQVWHRLHFRQAREVEVSVYRVLRERARRTKRDPRESWLCWMGKAPLPLEEVAATYRHRFSHEHTYRFLKQDLFWTKARVRTPQQFERWSLLVATAMNFLVLARHVGRACHRPWERRREVVTPRQVRRVMPAILAQLGTPAKEPKLLGKSPGWCKGTHRTPAPRFAVIKKPKPVPKTHRKRA